MTLKIAMEIIIFCLISMFPINVLSQLVVNPGEVISVPGGNSSFFCFSIGAQNIMRVEWRINHLPLEDINLEDVTANFIAIGGGVGALTFSNISLSDNMTSISCIADFEFGIRESSVDAWLLVQGLLSAVGSLNAMMLDSTISLTWTAPFTLDITSVDPDITYCVDVVNSTSSSTLHSECGIIETEFSYPTPPDTACHTYTFTVTPVNVVGRGEQNAATFSATSPKVLEVLRVSSNGDALNFTIIMSDMVCNSELISFMDLDTGQNMTTQVTALTKASNTNILTFVANLTVNRRYNLTIGARNTAGYAISHAIISTHDISDTTAMQTTGNRITIVTQYFEDSSASGALYVLIFITDSQEVDFSRLVMVPVDTNLNQTLSFGLLSGRYGVFVYDIEEGGTPANGVNYPAVTSEVTNTENGQGPPFRAAFSSLQSCDVSITLLRITAQCVYSSNSMSRSFQMIVQLGVLDEAGKLYVNQTTDRNTSASVVVPVEESGLYLVSIIPIMEGTGITESDVEYTEIVTVDDPTTSTDEENKITGAIIIGFGIFIIIIAAIIIVIIIIKTKRWKHWKLSKEENDADPQKASSQPTSPNDKASSRPTSPSDIFMVDYDP